MDELTEAARRLRSHIVETTPPVSEIYRRSDRRHRRHLRTGAVGGIVLAAATAGVLVAVLPSSHRLQVVTGGTGHDSLPAAAGTAVVTLTLDQRSVVAGQPITGVATIDNNTGKPIPVPDPACQALVTVGLANANIKFTGNSDLMLCPAVDKIPVGVSRQPITVATTYNTCSQDPTQASSGLPACVGPERNVMPPLPPGIYHTVTSVSSPFKVQDSVSVRLTTSTAIVSTATTGEAETSTTLTPTSTPSTTVVRNTLLRYWGPITGPYTDGEGLQLATPGSGVTPRVTWQEAALPCNRSTGINNCAAQTIPEDVFLAVGTETNSGQTGPDGSIIPVMNNTLVYVIAETFSCPSPPGGPSGIPTSPTTTPRFYSCVSLDFVDADTGRGLLGMDSPQLRLPPHA